MNRAYHELEGKDWWKKHELLFARLFWWIDYIMQMVAYLIFMLLGSLVFALTLITLAKSTSPGADMAIKMIDIIMNIFVIVWIYLYLKFLLTRPDYPKGGSK